MSNSSITPQPMRALDDVESADRILVYLGDLDAALSATYDIADVLQIKNRADAIRFLTGKMGLDQSVKNRATESQIRTKVRLGQLLNDMPKSKGGKSSLFQNATGMGTYAELGIDRTEAHRAQTLARLPSEKLDNFIKAVQENEYELTTGGAYAYARNSLNKQKRIENIKGQQAAAPLDDLARRFAVIYADPPWRYEHSLSESRAIENQYDTMSIDDICALPIREVSTDDSILFLWATSPKLDEAMSVIRAWEYVYRSSVVWDKEKIGMGYYVRGQHEFLLIAARGNMITPEPEDRPSSVYREARGDHSVKPDYFYRMIEAMYPELDKLEIFARRQRQNWTSWGNEIDG